MIDEYTPTTKEVQSAYEEGRIATRGAYDEGEFGRWLREHDRVVAQDARAKGYARAMADWEAEHD